MQRAIQLAKQGKYSVAPNPRVGAVVVHNNTIIGEGYHAKFGEAHAEVNAIASVRDQSLLSKSTLYVTLEPCSHSGKTPPCVDLILAHKIPQVVICNKDPFDQVDGSGIKILAENGVEVITSILEERGRELNKRFFTFHEQKRPYIILKWAETSDGFISREKAAIAGSNNWITNALSKQLVHQWRAEEQAILVGKNTVETDNPQLDCREFEGNNPIRLIIDPSCQLDSSKLVFNAAAKTIVFNERQSSQKGNIEYVQLEFGKNFMKAFNNFCYERQIQSAFVEGGRYTLSQFIASDNWDECRVFKGKTKFGDGVLVPDFKGALRAEQQLNEDHLSIYYRRH